MHFIKNQQSNLQKNLKNKNNCIKRKKTLVAALIRPRVYITLYNINKAINKKLCSNIKILLFDVEVMDQYDISHQLCN